MVELNINEILEKCKLMHGDNRLVVARDYRGR